MYQNNETSWAKSILKGAGAVLAFVVFVAFIFVAFSLAFSLQK